MKKVLRRIVIAALTALARAAITLHRPTVIAVTGSVGKTTTKDMLAAMLRETGVPVRASRKSYNSDIGVPLSIFDLPTGMHNPFTWIYIMGAAMVKTVIGLPKYIVLEVGLEYPGDIATITAWLKPDVSVMTRLPEHPVHLEHFSNKDEIYREKMSVLRATKPGGCAVYNAEDAVQKRYCNDLPKNIKLTDFNGNTVSVAETGIHYDTNRPTGTDAVLVLDGVREPFYIPEVLGTGVVQSMAAAVAAARCVLPGIAVSDMRKGIASRPPTPGRMRILRGLNGSVILDDSYNASPVAMEEALHTLKQLNMPKKVAVLGVMAQIGKHSSDLHRDVGVRARDIADTVIEVGTAGYGDGPNMAHCASAHEAAAASRDIADADTVFLCKGSQVAHIERVVKQLLAQPGDARLLVRQEKHWGS